MLLDPYEVEGGLLKKRLKREGAKVVGKGKSLVFRRYWDLVIGFVDTSQDVQPTLKTVIQEKVSIRGLFDERSMKS